MVRLLDCKVDPEYLPDISGGKVLTAVRLRRLPISYPAFTILPEQE